MPTDIENQRITTVPILKPDASRNRPDVALTARRTLSIQVPDRQPSARIPVEFRTLSLQLETGNTQPASHGTNAVKGAYCPITPTPGQVLFSHTPQTYPTSTGTTCLLTRRSAVLVSHRRPASTHRRRSVAPRGMDRTRFRRHRAVWCVKYLGGFSAASGVCCLPPASFASSPGNSLFSAFRSRLLLAY